MNLVEDVACPRCRGTGRIEVINGGFLRRRREAKGVGLREMARRLKFSAAYVSDVETGKRRVPREWIMFYQRALR